MEVKSSSLAASIVSRKPGFIDMDQAGKFVFSHFLMLFLPTTVAPRFLCFSLCSHDVKKLSPTLVEASTYPNIRLGAGRPQQQVHLVDWKYMVNNHFVLAEEVAPRGGYEHRPTLSSN